MKLKFNIAIYVDADASLYPEDCTPVTFERRRFNFDPTTWMSATLRIANKVEMTAATYTDDDDFEEII